MECLFWCVDCRKCPYSPRYEFPLCQRRVAKDMRDLITRQQADIEKLNAKNMLTISERNAFRTSFYDVLKQLKTAKSEAVKEFVDRLKEVSSEMIMCDNGTPISISYSISSKKLDSILKEMVGEENKNQCN